MLVIPERQREGIGTQLLSEAFQLIPKNETVKLDATPAGRAVYLKLGFIDEYSINRMYIGPHQIENLPNSFARPMRTSDLSGVLKLDREVFGADREQVLLSNMERALEYALVSEEHGRVMGFCFGRHGHHFNHIGPVIAANSDIASQLLSAAMRRGQGNPTVIDVLAHTPEWTRFVSSLGFVLLRPLLRMHKGLNASPGLPEKQFAILGPEFG